jgi:hypothetical protein
MVTEIWLCPFERRILGNRGEVLLRRNPDHATHCAAAIRRRRHPAWSQLNSTFRVDEGAAA